MSSFLQKIFGNLHITNVLQKIFLKKFQSKYKITNPLFFVFNFIHVRDFQWNKTAI